MKAHKIITGKSWLRMQHWEASSNAHKQSSKRCALHSTKASRSKTSTRNSSSIIWSRIPFSSHMKSQLFSRKIERKSRKLLFRKSVKQAIQKENQGLKRDNRVSKSPFKSARETKISQQRWPKHLTLRSRGKIVWLIITRRTFPLHPPRLMILQKARQTIDIPSWFDQPLTIVPRRQAGYSERQMAATLRVPYCVSIYKPFPGLISNNKFKIH